MLLSRTRTAAAAALRRRAVATEAAAAALPAVTVAYRRLLRARALAFRDDDLALVESRKAIRAGFSNASAETDPTTLAELHRGVDECVQMLTQNVIQSRLKTDDDGRDVYSAKIEERHVESVKAGMPITSAHVADEEARAAKNGGGGGGGGCSGGVPTKDGGKAS